MAENTLSPILFDRPFIKAYVPSENRFALSRVATERSMSETDIVRIVLAAGLEHLGWSPERVIREYAEYRVSCAKNHEANQFESR